MKPGLSGVNIFLQAALPATIFIQDLNAAIAVPIFWLRSSVADGLRPRS